MQQRVARLETARYETGISHAKARSLPHAIPLKSPGIKSITTLLPLLSPPLPHRVAINNNRKKGDEKLKNANPSQIRNDPSSQTNCQIIRTRDKGIVASPSRSEGRCRGRRREEGQVLGAVEGGGTRGGCGGGLGSRRGQWREGYE